MLRLAGKPVSEWTHEAAERAHNVNDELRERIHVAGEALLGHRPRRHWLATVGAFMLGIVIGAVVAMASLRRTPPPPEPVTENEDGATESVSAVPSHTTTANRSG